MEKKKSKMASYYSQSAPPTIYATAVPVAPAYESPTDYQSSTAVRDGSQYSLPQVNRSTEVSEEQVRRLKEQGFTTGLAKALSANHTAFPLRIWVVDNSGSMQKTDGHRIVDTVRKNDVRIVSCTRWEEIRECVNYHAQMAAMLEAPTTFRLLNDPGAMVGPQQFGVAEMGREMISQNLQLAMDTMRKARPGGCTPLTRHINDIRLNVSTMAPELQREGKRVAIIIATDGLPTDEMGYGGDHISRQFVEALRSLEGLPVWVVVKLCTDEDNVVEFYNELDEQLELSLEVLDDFIGEAQEVYEQNKWLNYALPLHRCREMGFHDRVFDMLDERALTKGELRDFCALLFGQDKFDGVPDPALDWGGFMHDIERMLKEEKGQWNPIKKKVTPWIDLKVLNKMYGDGSACTIM